MKRVFLSHASEDKPFVEHVYSKLKNTYPDVEPWLDKYEIVGGDSLIDKIADGIDTSDKFVIFLSDTSIQKPWVSKELKKAIIAEIERGNENFIVPVLINNIFKTPAFLEDKFYIDISNYTEDELISALYHAINEQQPDASGNTIENLTIAIFKKEEWLEVQFGAKYWAEKIAFEIHIDQEFEENVIKGFSESPNSFNATFVEEKVAGIYRVCIASQRITPDNFFFVIFKIKGDVKDIVTVKKWNEGFKKPMNVVLEIRK